jgi:transcriptional regulator CtsR
MGHVAGALVGGLERRQRPTGVLEVASVDTRNQATLLAVILMRVQVDTPDQRLDPMADLMLEQAFTSDEEMALLLSGMSNLAQHLLVKLQQATGATTSEILDDIARQVQR